LSLLTSAPSHFTAYLLFAALLSIAFASLTPRPSNGRVKYALLSFALFVVIGVGIAWLMYPLSR